MDLILGKPLKRYFLEHVKCDGMQYVVTEPLRVFKKLHIDTARTRCAIANLIIPVGARVNAPESVFSVDTDENDRKMRANEAIVDSIRRLSIYDRADAGPLRTARSNHDLNFMYKVGQKVLPNSFDRSRRTCAPGIHFFLNLKDALIYCL